MKFLPKHSHLAENSGQRKVKQRPVIGHWQRSRNSTGTPPGQKRRRRQRRRQLISEIYSRRQSQSQSQSEFPSPSGTNFRARATQSAAAGLTPFYNWICCPICWESRRSLRRSQILWIRSLRRRGVTFYSAICYLPSAIRYPAGPPPL